MLAENKISNSYNKPVALKKQVVSGKKYIRITWPFRGVKKRDFRQEKVLYFLSMQEKNKTLEALQKLQELKVKYFKTQNALQWAAGQLN